MLRDKIVMACTFLLLSSLLLTALPMHAVAASGSPVLLSEDAEELTYDDWNSRWERFDLNADSGQDWWCRSAHNLHDSAHAIYASRNGFNSHYQIPVTMADGSPSYTQAWNVNVTGLPSIEPQSQWVPRYDTNQDSIMKKKVVGASSYNVVTLTFWFWSDTGASDAKQPLTGTSVGYDFLNVLYWTNSGDSATKKVLWTDTPVQAGAKAWIYATVDVPNDVDAIGFEFVSGTTAPEGGDASDAFASSGVRVVNGGMREGVYIDDIVLTGSDAAPGTIPVKTSVDNLAMVQSGRTFDVRYTVNTPTVPFDHVDLYYRQGSSGDWLKYGGDYSSSPISFTAPSDGRYELFTQGFDANGGSEGPKYSPDAATIVDTAAPTTTIGVTGTSTGDGTYSGSASFTFTATDGGSGVNSTYYRVDSGSWIRYDGSTVTLTNGGAHQVQYRSSDMAGNTEAVRSTSMTIVTTNPVVTFLEPSKTYTSRVATVGFQVTGSSNIVELRASLDGRANSTIDPELRSVTFTDLTAGTHHATIWARDSEGRWGQNMTSFIVDLSNPTNDGTSGGMTLTMGGLSASYRVGDTVHVTWSCTIESGEIDHCSVLVDGSIVATLSADKTSYDLTGLSAGSHAISVLAVDGNGNTVQKSMNVSVKGTPDAPGGISQDVIIIGGIAVFGVVAAVLLVYLRSRRMY